MEQKEITKIAENKKKEKNQQKRLGLSSFGPLEEMIFLGHLFLEANARQCQCPSGLKVKDLH